MKLESGFEILADSDLNYEQMTGSIMHGDVHMAQIIVDKGLDEVEILLHAAPPVAKAVGRMPTEADRVDVPVPVVRLEDFLEAIEVAKKVLASYYDEGLGTILTDPTALVGGTGPGRALANRSTLRGIGIWVRGLFVRKGVLPGYPHTVDDLIRAASQPINTEGVTKAARAWKKHAAGQRASGTFPRLTGGLEARNIEARRIVESTLRNPRSTTTPTPRGGVEVRDPSGHGLRFGRDGSFIGFPRPAMKTEHGFEILANSDLNYEEMTATIKYDGVYMFQLSMDRGFNKMDIYLYEDQPAGVSVPVVPLADFLEAIEEAKKMLSNYVR